MKRRNYVLISTVLCALAMAFVDGVVQPPYAMKSTIKILLFLVVPMGYFVLFRAWDSLKALFHLQKRELLAAFALGIGGFGVITGGYMLISRFFSLDEAILTLTAEGGVNPDNFLPISFYIAIVNSLLEEFFFRGFAFLSLTRRMKGASLLSAVSFALYHTAMMLGWFPPAVFALALAGLTVGGMIFNWLDQRDGSIYAGWLVHMFANFAINTVGMILFYQ